MTININDRSLFDVEDVQDVPPVRDLTVQRATSSDVDEFCLRYHYTTVGGSKLWRWGLYDGPVLYGVVAYNLPTRTVCESVFGPEQYANVWHMGRLVLADKAPPNSESRLIGGSMREIRRQYPDVWAVLTYAATDVGHIGYVYQATNAIYTGLAGDPVYFLDADGGRHSTYLSGYVTDARAAALGWTKHLGGPKHRYVYVLGSKTQRRHRLAALRLPRLPYPKQYSIEGIESA